jgi:hypothetical protein
MSQGVNDDPPGHRGKLILVMCALTRRIAVQAPFSDLKSLHMDYLSFFYHWAAFFSLPFFFGVSESFSPRNESALKIPRKELM